MIVNNKNTFHFLAIQDINLLALKPHSFGTLCLYPKESFFISVELTSLLQGNIGNISEVTCFTSFYGNPTSLPTIGNLASPATVSSQAPLFPDQQKAPVEYLFGPVSLLEAEGSGNPNATAHLNYGLYNFRVEIFVSLDGVTEPIKFQSSDPRIVVGDEGGG